MVETRKQRERRSASTADAAYGLSLLGIAYGWLQFRSLLAGLTIGVAFLGMVAVGLLLIRNRHDGILRRAGLGDLDRMNGEQFEELLQAKFRANGYRVTLTPNGADFGADLLLDRNGTRTAIQAKHWKTRKVGVRAVREVVAARAHYGADQAAVIASGDFTDQAVQLAASNGVYLWDRARLARELLNHASRAPLMAAVETEAQPVSVRERELPVASTPYCPRCGTPMVRRSGRYGPFWGCSNYPGCRATIKM